MTFRAGETFREKEGHGGVGIDLVDGCNIRCQQCFYQKGSSPFRMLTFNQAKTIIQKTQKTGMFKEFYILGGEPTLHPQLPEIIRFAQSRFGTVILVTNGILLANKEYCRKIARPKLTISMHRRAIKPEARGLVNELAQSKGAFDLYEKAWENVGKYWQGEVCVQLNLLRPLVTGGHALDVFKWAREQGYEPIMELTKPGPIFERGHALDVPIKEIEELYAKMRTYDRQYHPGKEASMEVVVPPAYGHNCTLVETGIHVQVDGTVVPCVAHAGFPLGNIFQDDLEDMLNSDIRLAIKDYANWIVGPCRRCVHFEYCHGGCRGEALWDTGCPRASDPYCWHIPKGLTLRDMVPENCNGCLLKGNLGCKIKV